MNPDGLYIYDGPAGQMIQDLGEAHNADVLLEPPVQTPFYYRTRLLSEYPWQLVSGENTYLFQLPDEIMKRWLNNSIDDIRMKKTQYIAKNSLCRI